MIDDWRGKWKNASGHTSALLPFGFVQVHTPTPPPPQPLAPLSLPSQLAAYGSDNSSSFTPGFPVIRWAQTADYGFVPNPRLPAVFMAVAMDLGDPTSPFGSIHPRDKQDVGHRLALAGRAIAYGDSDVYFTGPLATTATIRYSTSLNKTPPPSSPPSLCLCLLSVLT